MKHLTSLILAAAILALTSPGYAWVRGGGGGYHGSYSGYHSGYNCGGVTTGTTAAHGYNGFAAGTRVTPNTQPVYVAPTYGYGTTYTTAPPPPPVPPVNAPSVGTIVYSLPPGAQMTTVNGMRYYEVTNSGVTTYYQAFFGNNGVYYIVQAGPS